MNIHLHVFYFRAMNLRTFISFFIALLAIGCNKPDAPACLKKAGNVSIEVREMSAIEVLEINDLVHVNVFTASEGQDRVVVRGPKNLLPGLVTVQSGTNLIIGNENRCNWVRDFGVRLEVDVHSSALRHVGYYGQGDVLFADTLYGELFTFENRGGFGDVLLRLHADSASVEVHTGHSNVTLEGVVTSAALFNQGWGRFDAGALDALVISCNNSSFSDMIVRTRGYLYAYIGASGNVLYFGTPDQIDLERVGSGALLPLGD